MAILLAVLLAAGAAPSDASSFVSDYLVTDFGADSGWPDSVLRADGFEPWLHGSQNVFGKPQAFRLTLRGTRGAMVWVHIGSHFQRFTRELGPLTGEAQTFDFPAPPGPGWVHSGAAENSVSYPLRIVGISAKGPDDRCEIELEELRCVTEVRRDRAVTLLPRLKTGAKGAIRQIKAQCTGWNLADHEAAGAVRMVVRDWEDRVLHDETQPWRMPPGGEVSTAEFTASIPAALNFADAEFTFASAECKAQARASFIRPTLDRGDAQLRPDSPWGMGVYLYRYPHVKEGHETMDRAAAIAQGAGVKWSREEFSWARTEPRRGEYDFEFYDVVVDTARRHGISVYGLLAYWSGWTKPYTEEGIDDYVAWTRAVVRHFKDRVKHWEIYNEPNIFFWDGPKELYPVMMKRAYEAIKEEDPDATVLAISTAGIDTKFIQMCLDAGAPFDVLTVHPYRKSMQEDKFMDELAHAAKQVSGRPVWITEMGWSTQVDGVSEREQAQLLARSYLAAVASGACRNVSWYNFRNDGNNPFYNEENFGVLHASLSGKPAFRALATVCRRMAETRPMQSGGRDGVYFLQMGKTVAVWTSLLEEVEATVSGKVKRDGFYAVNLMDEPIDLEPGRRRVKLSLRPGCPVFLSGIQARNVKVKAQS